MEKNTLLVSTLIGMTVLLICGGVFAYTIEDDSVFIEDDQASLRVTPHTAQFPSPEGYNQEFEVCNKTSVNTNLFAAYVFDNNLTYGKVEYLANEGYEWVEHQHICLFEFDYNTFVNPAPNVHQAECYYFSGEEKIVDFSMAFKTGNPETGEITYDVNELIKTWTNVTSQFNHYEIQNKQAYAFTSGKQVAGETCETWRVTYTPKIFASGKWDLWLWADNDWTCIMDGSCLKELKLDPWWTGSGSESDPFMIADCNGIQNIDTNCENSNVYFELESDIDCTGFEDWEAICTEAAPFQGFLNGNNYSISNLVITSAAGEAQGAMFGTINSGTVENLALIDFNVSAGSGNRTGALAGICSNCNVDQVYVQGGEIGNFGFGLLGGLIGYCSASSSVSNSYIVDATVSATTGGLRVGGLIGAVNDSNIFHSYSNATIIAGAGDTGGFVGHLTTGYCYDAFWDKTTSGYDASACGTGEVTADMFKEATFANWNFEDIWEIEEDVNYPTLQAFVPPAANAAPYMTGIDLNVSYSQENGDIKTTASGSGDADSDALTLLCGTAATPTTDTNDFCTAYAVASPYADISCVGKGASGDAVKTVYCRMYDGTDYSIDQNTDTYTADNTAPAIAVNDFNNDWQNTDANLQFACSDAGSGCNKFFYSVNDINYVKTWGDGNIGIVLDYDYNHEIFYIASDAIDNNSADSLLYLAIDKEAPTSDHNIVDDGVWFAYDVNVNISCFDANAGCRNLYYGIVGDANYQYTWGYDLNIGILVNTDGNTEIWFWNDDNSTGIGDNNETPTYLNIGIDTTAPTTDHNSFLDWYAYDFNVNFACSDGIGAGCKNLYYAVYDTNYTVAWIADQNIGLNITLAGQTIIWFWSDDIVDNNGTSTQLTVGIDRVDPVTTVSQLDKTLTLTCTDAASGCLITYYSLDGAAYVASNTFTVLPGDYTLSYYSLDEAGNVETPIFTTITYGGTAPPSTGPGPSPGPTIPPEPDEPVVFDFFVCNPSENYCYFPTRDAVDFEDDESFLGIFDDFDGDGLNNSVDLFPYGQYNSIIDRPLVQNGLFVTEYSFYESSHLFFHYNFFEPKSSFEIRLSPGIEIGACTASASYTEVHCFVEDYDTLLVVFDYVEDANLVTSFSFDVLAESPDFNVFSQRFNLTVVNLAIYQGLGVVNVPSSASILTHPFIFKVDANNNIVGLRWMPFFALAIFLIMLLVLYFFKWNPKVMVVMALLAVLLVLAVMVFSLPASLLVAIVFLIVLASLIIFIAYNI